METSLTVFAIIIGLTTVVISIMNFGTMIGAIGSILGFLLELFGSAFWYLFVFINLMIPQIILLGVLAYRSKPTEDSFKKCFDSFMSFAKQQDTDNVKDNFLARTGTYIAKSMFIKGLELSTNTYFLDCGIFMLAYMVLPNKIEKKGREEKEAHMFVGVFGTWIPMY